MVTREHFISVLMPVHNGERYLHAAMDSICKQTLSDFELIIVDDGSTDQTPRIIESYSRRDRRIQPIRTSQKGIVSALNVGLEAAKGSFIARMDADDIAHPYRLERQRDFLLQHSNVVAAGCQVQLIDPLGMPLRQIKLPTSHFEIEESFLSGQTGVIAHPAAMIRTEAIHQIGGYRAEYEWAEDLDLFLRLAKVGRLANIDETLLDYRQHSTNVSRQKQEVQQARAEAAVREACQQRGRSIDHRVEPAYERLTKTDLLRSWALHAIGHGYRKPALHHASSLLLATPWRIESWRIMRWALLG